MLLAVHLSGGSREHWPADNASFEVELALDQDVIARLEQRLDDCLRDCVSVLRRSMRRKSSAKESIISTLRTFPGRIS